MKKICLNALLALLPILAFPQAIGPFKLIDVGTGASANVVSGDAETFKRTSALNFTLGYNLNSYHSIIAELQLGTLAGGDSLSKSGREFQNRFKSVQLRTQAYLGLIMDSHISPLADACRNFYLGLGVGFIDNEISQINRSSLLVPGYYSGGKNRSVNAYIPARIGYEFKIKNLYKETLIKLDLGYQYNYVFGDDVDGFDAGRFSDTFSQLFVGVKFGLLRQWRHLY